MVLEKDSNVRIQTEKDKGVEDDDALVPTIEKKTIRALSKNGTNVVKEKVTGKYRACLVCRIVASEAQFLESGCPNCPFIELKGNKNNVLDYTTAKFSGMLAVTQPERSWAAQFNNLNKGIPGCYAIEAYGEFPEKLGDVLHSKH